MEGGRGCSDSHVEARDLAHVTRRRPAGWFSKREQYGVFESYLLLHFTAYLEGVSLLLDPERSFNLQE